MGWVSEMEEAVEEEGEGGTAGAVVGGVVVEVVVASVDVGSVVVGAAGAGGVSALESDGVSLLSSISSAGANEKAADDGEAGTDGAVAVAASAAPPAATGCAVFGAAPSALATAELTAVATPTTFALTAFTTESNQPAVLTCFSFPPPPPVSSRSAITNSSLTASTRGSSSPCVELGTRRTSCALNRAMVGSACQMRRSTGGGGWRCCVAGLVGAVVVGVGSASFLA